MTWVSRVPPMMIWIIRGADNVEGWWSGSMLKDDDLDQCWRMMIWIIRGADNVEGWWSGSSEVPTMLKDDDLDQRWRMMIWINVEGWWSGINVEGWWSGSSEVPTMLKDDDLDHQRCRQCWRMMIWINVEGWWSGSMLKDDDLDQCWRMMIWIIRGADNVEGWWSGSSEVPTMLKDDDLDHQRCRHCPDNVEGWWPGSAGCLPCWRVMIWIIRVPPMLKDDDLDHQGAANAEGWWPGSSRCLPCWRMNSSIFFQTSLLSDQLVPPLWHWYTSCIPWLTCCKRNLTCTVIALDFSKAFDTVHHSTLLVKFSVLPLLDCVYNWLLDYFSNRQHCTRFMSIISEFLTISASIIQGTGIGPVLYIVNASDLNAIYLWNKLFKYDDSYLIVPASQSNTIQQELQAIESWYVDNYLMLNTKKSTEIIIRKPGSKDANLPPPPIQRIQSESDGDPGCDCSGPSLV